jgi:hypothetical protein
MLWVTALAGLARFTWRRSGKILIAGSDCAQVFAGQRFSVVYRDAVIRVFDESGNVIETHEHAGDFREAS